MAVEGNGSSIEFQLHDLVEEDEVQQAHTSFDIESTLETQYEQNQEVQSSSSELPPGVFDSIRFTKDASSVSHWLNTLSRKRQQHVDYYKCKSYISFNESADDLTALHLACLHNRTQIIKLLLQAGADVRVTDRIGRTALHYLCSCDSEEPISGSLDMITERLLNVTKHHEIVNQPDEKYGRTPLLEACLLNKRATVFALLNSELQAEVNVVDSAGMGPLHCVCASPAPAEDVEPLFDFIFGLLRDSFDTRDNQGRTPFLVSCEHGKPMIAKKLLSAGADVYAEDNNQRTALHHLSASTCEYTEELMKIITRRVTHPSTRISVFLGNEDQDIDGPTASAINFVNKEDANGQTPLQIALSHNNPRINNALVLISSGADIKIRLADGRNPLELACDSSHPKPLLAKSLIKHGADISIRVGEDSSPLLHFACRENLVDLVKCLLEHGASVMQRNDDQKKPIYYTQSYEVHNLLIKAGAIDYGYRDPKLLDECCCKGLTDRAIYLIQHIKEDFVKAKHLNWAVKYNYKGIAMALVKHPNWFSFLRHTDEGENGIPTTPFRELIKKMPDVAEMVLDRCLVSDPKFKGTGNSDYTVIMNYEFLEDCAIPRSDDSRGLPSKDKDRQKAVPEIRGHDCSYERLNEVVPRMQFSTKWGPVGFSKSNHPLSIMVDYGREKLLTHPVVGSLLHYKWNSFGHYGYYINLFTFCLLVFFLNLYALLLEDPISEDCIAVRTNNTSSLDKSAKSICDVTRVRPLVVYVTATIVILIALLRFSHETSQIIKSHTVQKKNYAIKLLLYVCSIIFAAVYWADCQCITTWQWQFGVMAVFLSWLNLIIFISRFPLTGIYIIMLIRVLYTFLKVVLLSSLLVIAFGISFYMAYRDPAIVRSPFSTPARSLLKLVTMTTGEFEFDNIFRQSPNGDSDGEEEIPFEIVSYILWIIFIVVMPILLTNMLVGLAVGDIDRIQKAASLQKLALQVNLVLAVERTLRSRPFHQIHSIAWKKIYPNSKITSMSMSEVSKLSEKRLQWKKFLSYLKFEVWGGERYDSLKTITECLSRAQHNGADASSLSDYANSAPELEKLLKQNAELVMEVKKSREEFQTALELLSKIADTLPTQTAPSPVAFTAPWAPPPSTS